MFLLSRVSLLSERVRIACNLGVAAGRRPLVCSAGLGSGAGKALVVAVASAVAEVSVLAGGAARSGLPLSRPGGGLGGCSRALGGGLASAAGVSCAGSAGRSSDAELVARVCSAADTAAWGFGSWSLGGALQLEVGKALE